MCSIYRVPLKSNDITCASAEGMPNITRGIIPCSPRISWYCSRKKERMSARFQAKKLYPVTQRQWRMVMAGAMTNAKTLERDMKEEGNNMIR
jgi:hypothetical protein